jgi:hypothetical protein
LARVADPDPVLFYPLVPGSGSELNFFSDPGSNPFFDKIFLHYLSRNRKQHEKGIFTFATPYVGPEIRDEKILASGIKHPGSATLPLAYFYRFLFVKLNFIR